MKAGNYAESYRLRRGSYFIKCDVSKSADVKAMVENHSYFGRLDYAFNNAGIEGDSAPTADCTEEN
jgi:NAD(P)-dependent dehydrogenase (short-subunit alcohol dehydrogenase family)